MRRKEVLDIISTELDRDRVEVLDVKNVDIMEYTMIYFVKYQGYGYIVGFVLDNCIAELYKYIDISGESAVLKLDIAGSIDDIPVIMYGGGLSDIVEYTLCSNKDIRKFTVDLSSSDLSNMISLESILCYDASFEINREWELVVQMPTGSNCAKPVSAKFAFCDMPVINGDSILKSIDFSETEDVDNMFENTAIKSIDLDNIGCNMIQSSRKMFADCRKLESVEISKQRFEYLKDITSMFSDCESLNHMDVGVFLNSLDKLNTYAGVFNNTYNIQWWRKDKRGLIINCRSRDERTDILSKYSAMLIDSSSGTKICEVMDMRGVKYLDRNTGNSVSLAMDQMFLVNGVGTEMPASVLIINKEQALLSNIDEETQHLTIWRERIATVIRIDSMDAVELVLHKAKLFGENIICILNDSE